MIFDKEIISIFVGLILGLLVGTVTLAGPTWLFVEEHKALWREDFVKISPDKKWHLFIHPVFVVVGIALGFFFTINIVEAQSQQVPTFFAFLPFLFSALVTTGIGILNGLFEFLTGIIPVHRSKKIAGPIHLLGPWVCQYIEGKEIEKTRRIGLIRMGLGVGIFSICYFVALLIAQ